MVFVCVRAKFVYASIVMLERKSKIINLLFKCGTLQEIVNCFENKKKVVKIQRP